MDAGKDYQQHVAQARGVHSSHALISLCFVLSLLLTGIEWSSLSQDTLESNVEKDMSNDLLLGVRPAVNQPIHLRDIPSNETRNVILVEPDMMATETIFKFSFHAGCFTMRNREMRNNCNRNAPYTKLDSILKNVNVLYHPRFGATRDATTLFFNLRHPVDRLVTWYNYAHPDNCINQSLGCLTKRKIEKDPEGWEFHFFRRCFPVFDNLIETFQNDFTEEYTGNYNSTCTYLAEKLVSGERDENEIAIHMAANLRHYHTNTIALYPYKETWVVRTEHVYDDLNALELLLGGESDQYGGNEFFASLTKHVDEFLVKQVVPQHTAKLLCCVLIDDLIVYSDVLNRAGNMDEISKHDEWSDVMQRCGVDAWTKLKQDCSTISKLKNS
ncbi:hypothetical protein FisN_17Hu198 [Fistulifera solaris]|uniref:Sulfotransferase domain-containing protein n=1 Tax=Fistulifera solaris TaxID=1519565 RepID=A0A1Z5JHM2_FISSO|nr:hypothetical protein FisN_17Hu198 [Fistulifera solaris]|eukprot:GAX13261.1 hypothetical protein FisN_17Hu198 [Fistulifera solaris]